MANIIIQVSKYLIIILMAVYTFSCFSIFTRSYEDEENKVLIRQDITSIYDTDHCIYCNVFCNAGSEDDVHIWCTGSDCDGSHLIIQSDLPECFETGCQ